MAKLSKLYTVKQITAIRNELIAKHGNQCAICKKPREAFKNSLSVDHNHKTGRIRGLLCYRCNKFRVGRQTIETAQEVIEYLVAYDGPLGETDEQDPQNGEVQENKRTKRRREAK